MNKKFKTKDAISILTIGVVLLVIYVMYKIFLLLKDPFGTKKEDQELAEKIEVDESKLSKPLYWYYASAQAIEIAILSDLDEDESAVDAIIWEIQNDDDIAQLIKDFGVRQDVYFGVLPSVNYTLQSAVVRFLPERINDYNNHFKGWKMKFRF